MENSRQQEAPLTALAAKAEKAGALRWLLPRRRPLWGHVCAVGPSGAISEDERGGSSQTGLPGGIIQPLSRHLRKTAVLVLGAYGGQSLWDLPSRVGSVEAKEQFQVVGNAMKKKTGLEE